MGLCFSFEQEITTWGFSSRGGEELAIRFVRCVRQILTRSQDNVSASWRRKESQQVMCVFVCVHADAESSSDLAGQHFDPNPVSCDGWNIKYVQMNKSHSANLCAK